jgi:hypothetical protein
MKCISSPALDDTQIVGFMEGEADESVVAHIKECPYCSEKAREWARWQNRLKKQLYRVTCPTTMELGEYQLDLLSPPRKMAIAQHVRDCPLCRQEVASLEDFLRSLAPESNLLDEAKILITSLVGAQTQNGFAPVLRGEAKGPLTFEADGIVIVLDVQPADEGRFDILGQVAADNQDQWTGALMECEGITAGKQELKLIPTGGSPVVVTNLEL